jgi:hypothetical protein
VPPIINCPGDLSFECAGDVPAAFITFIDFINGGGSASDNCGLDETTFMVQTMGKIWDEKIANSEALKEYAKSKAQAVKVMWGEEAAKAGLESTQIMAWQLHAGGKSAVSPDTVGIPPLKK